MTNGKGGKAKHTTTISLKVKRQFHENSFMNTHMSLLKRLLIISKGRPKSKRHMAENQPTHS